MSRIDILFISLVMVPGLAWFYLSQQGSFFQRIGASFLVSFLGFCVFLGIGWLVDRINRK